MTLRDFFLLVGVCLIWGMSNVLSKLVVGNWHIPPLFFAAVRFCIVLAATLPWLRPVPRPLWRIVAVGLLMGAGNFALLFIGLQSASPSSAAVVIQAGVPITTLLSIAMLGERIHWRRALGIALTLVGVLVVQNRAKRTYSEEEVEALQREGIGGVGSDGHDGAAGQHRRRVPGLVRHRAFPRAGEL